MLVSRQGEPTELTRYASHTLVGVATGFLVAKHVGRPLPAIVLAVTAAGLHELLDAPVADVMASLAA
jgi:hypothetical protein